MHDHAACQPGRHRPRKSQTPYGLPGLKLPELAFWEFLGLSETCREDAAPSEVLARWHFLTPEVKLSILALVRVGDIGMVRGFSRLEQRPSREIQGGTCKTGPE